MKEDDKNGVNTEVMSGGRERTEVRNITKRKLGHAMRRDNFCANIEGRIIWGEESEQSSQTIVLRVRLIRVLTILKYFIN